MDAQGVNLSREHENVSFLNSIFSPVISFYRNEKNRKKMVYLRHLFLSVPRIFNGPLLKQKKAIERYLIDTDNNNLIDQNEDNIISTADRGPWGNQNEPLNSNLNSRTNLSNRDLREGSLKKKKKSAVYKFKNIPPVIFGEEENSQFDSTKPPVEDRGPKAKNSSRPAETPRAKDTTLTTTSALFSSFEGPDLQSGPPINIGSLKSSEEGTSKKIISYCPNCEVEILPNSIRRYRLGYIEFTYPVTHIWYLSSYITLLLNFSRSLVEGISECHESLSFGFPPLSAWAYNGSEPISWTFQNQALQFPIHLNFSVMQPHDFAFLGSSHKKENALFAPMFPPIPGPLRFQRNLRGQPFFQFRVPSDSKGI